MLINNRRIPVVRRIFVVAPNLVFADKTSCKSAESAVRRVLRGRKPYEIGRTGAYFDDFSMDCRRRRTLWRSELDSNPRSHESFTREIRPDFGAIFDLTKRIFVEENLFA